MSFSEILLTKKIFYNIEENAFEIDFWENSTILSWPQWIKSS